MLANIKLGTQDIELRDGTHVDMQVTLGATLTLLVELLAKENPTWDFTPNYVAREYEEVLIEGRRYNQISNLVARQVAIAQGKDTLGTVGVEAYSYTKERYNISSPRIREQRSRGTETKTQDLKKARALVKKMFFPKTELEVVKDGFTTLHNGIAELSRKHRYAFNEVWNRIGTYAVDFVIANMEEFKPFVQDQTILATLDSFGERKSMRDKTKEFERAFEKNEACGVTTIGDMFYVSSTNQKVFGIPRDKVEGRIKVKIGMLKLLEDNTYVEGIGLKVKEDMFIIDESIHSNIVSKEVTV